MDFNAFYNEYERGRRDFSGVDLSGVDFYLGFISKKHPDLVNKDLSQLIMERDPVIHERIATGDFSELCINEANLVAADLRLSDFSSISARHADMRLSDFSGVDFSKADLKNANLFGCNFEFCDFKDADLKGADFQCSSFKNVNFENTEMSDVKFSRSVLKSCAFTGGDSNDVIFYGCYFEAVKFKSVFFKRFVFSDSVFFRGGLDLVELSSINFKGTVFENFDVYDSRITNCDFSSVKMNDFDLDKSLLKSCRFDRAALINVSFGFSTFHDSSFIKSSFDSWDIENTVFENVLLYESHIHDTRLEQFFGNTLTYQGVNSVDYRSIARVIANESSDIFELNPAPELHDFLEMCGMPSLIALYLIDSIRSIEKGELRKMMHRTYICYAGEDKEFAEKLNRDLSRKGVPTEFFEKDAEYGEKLYKFMDRLWDCDKVIFICSRVSLKKFGVKYELDRVFSNEALGNDQSKLIPIAIDDFLFEDVVSEMDYFILKIKERVIGDFRDNYEEGLMRLLSSLKKDKLNWKCEA